MLIPLAILLAPQERMQTARRYFSNRLNDIL